MFHMYITQFGGPAFEPSTHTHVSVGTCVYVRVSRLSPASCNSVAFSLKQRESESNLGPPGQFCCFVHIKPNTNPYPSLGVWRSPLDPRPGIGWCQCVRQGVSSVPYYVLPVAFVLKQRELE